jgi:transposase
MMTTDTNWREIRRFRAIELKAKGWKQNAIAEALGVTEGAVSQWLKKFREGGEEALREHWYEGPPFLLTEEQRAKIPDLLTRGAESYGFRGNVWTLPRVTVVIKREFGVDYHPSHVSRVLRDVGWTLQKPMRRAIQRNEPAIQKWREEEWPRIKTKQKKIHGRSSSPTSRASTRSPE